MTPSIFKLLIDVQNVIAIFDGRLTRVGFFVTRIVEANSLEEAFLKAKRDLLNSPEYTSAVKNTSDNPPVVTLDEHERIAPTSDDNETGFLFYDNSPD